MVCPRKEADELFAPILACMNPAVRDTVSISKEDYSVITIGGEGLDAGQRVLDLTTPLAMTGISIYFITSYWSDFILVPLKARTRVINTLEDRGFVFEADSNSEAGHMINPASPLLNSHHGPCSSTSSTTSSSPTSPTPPSPKTTTISTTTTEQKPPSFHPTTSTTPLLPKINRQILLVTCAGIKETTPTTLATNFTQGKLQLGLLKCLTLRPTPRFFSLTLTNTESASITLEKSLLHLFYHDGEDLLLGKDGPAQVPISFDLRVLPAESTGVVCGVEGRLIEGLRGGGDAGGVGLNVSYLSTVGAGHVIVYEDELDGLLAG